MSRYRLKLLAGTRVGSVTPTNPKAAPSMFWDGTEGSGYATLGAEPTPNFLSNSLVLPVAFEMQEQLTVFTTNRTVGFWALMNPAAGVVTGVYWDIEGQETQATGMTLVSRIDERTGETIQEAQYAFELDTANFAHEGTFRSYLRVTHTGSDPDLIYGPLVYNHFASTYDGLIEISASQPETSTRKKLFKDAVIAAQALGYTRPEYRVIETASYEFGSVSGGTDFRVPVKFWRTFTTAPGVTATIANAALKAFRQNCNNLRFAGKFLFDVKNYQDGWFLNDNYNPWMISFAGPEIFNSDPLGRNYLVNSATMPNIIRPVTNANTVQFAYFRDVWIHDTQQGIKHGRGWNVKSTGIAGDVYTSWRFIYGADIEDIDATFLRTPLAVIQISSTVPMTVAKTEYNGWRDGTLVIKKPGDPNSPWVIPLPESPITSPTYLPSGVVAAINALGIAGLTCTGINPDGRIDERRAGMISMASVSGFGAFPDTDIQGDGITLITASDIHSDVTQLTLSSSQVAAVALVNIKGMSVQASQNIFMSGIQGHRNMLFVNWEIQNGPASHQTHIGYYTETNIGLLHVTMPLQSFDIPATGYPKLGLYGVVANRFLKDKDATSAGAVGVGNYALNQGAAPPPNAALVGTVGNATSADFVDFENYDFTPAVGGVFDLNRIARVYPYDINHKLRPTLTTATARET